MNRHRPEIFLGDFATALEQLQPVGDGAQEIRSAIARLLGFEETLENAPEKARQTQIEETSSVSTPSPAGMVDHNKPQADGNQRRAEATWLPSRFQTIPTETATSNLYLSQLLAKAQPLSVSKTEWRVPAVPPLFEPKWARGIITAMLATCREGDIDFEKLIELLAEAHPLSRLPRIPWPTLRRGATVLLDAGPSLAPYSEDQRWLLTQLRLVLGFEKTDAFKFYCCPGRGVHRGMQPKSEWVPPMAGTPVLILSDLGLGRDAFPLESASEAEWLEFADSVRLAGCPLIVLAPASPRHFSSRLRQAYIIIEWDRGMTAGRLRRVVGRAHRIN